MIEIHIYASEEFDNGSHYILLVPSIQPPFCFLLSKEGHKEILVDVITNDVDENELAIILKETSEPIQMYFIKDAQGYHPSNYIHPSYKYNLEEK